MFVIDDELRELIESGVATVVGTTDAEQRPHAMYGWGLRVREDRHSLELFMEAERAGSTLANLEETGRIAVTIADPVSYRSLQFKGRFIGRGTPTAEDEAWVERHRDAFATTTALVGDSPASIRNRWMRGGMVRIEFEVERAFDQTPGPEAGREL